MALSYISNKEIKFGSARPLNGVYTPGLPVREYEPLDSLGIYLNSGIPISYGVENGRYMSMSDEFVASYRTPTHNGEFIEGRGRTPREAILGKHENRLKFKFLGWLE